MKTSPTIPIFATKKGAFMDLMDNDTFLINEMANKSTYCLHLPSVYEMFVKSYLYKQYLERKTDLIIKVIKVLSIKNFEESILRLPEANYSGESGLYSFTETCLLFSVEYLNESYELLFYVYKERDFNDEHYYRRCYLSINGTSKKSERAKELSKELIVLALSESPLRNKKIRFNAASYEGDLFKAIEIVKPPNLEISDLYLPKIQSNEVKRFIQAINQYDKHRISFRFLLNGKPGTGKTQLINSVITGTRDTATVLICTGGYLPIKSILDFCKNFEPCLLIIDDVDFISQDRNHNTLLTELGEFLQMLDGFLPNNVFLLAATNDKKLVDLAASRPGRFDLILDLAEIEPIHYLSLIKRETNNPNILDLFDEEALIQLENRKVTGAFLVSFIKQINSALLLNGEITKHDFYQYLNLCYKGFYSTNNTRYDKVIGFGEVN